MAVIDELPGVEVTVEVDGVALKEYEDSDEEEPAKTVVRYLEAASAKEFSIKLQVEKTLKLKGNVLVARYYADGQKARGVVLHKKDLVAGKCDECLGFDNHQTITKFCFSELETVSDGRKMDTEVSRTEELGVLRVLLYHGNKGVSLKAQPLDFKPSEVGIVSEKALKGRALSHSIGTGGTLVSDAVNMLAWSHVYGASDDDPAATFEFRYRSREALKAMLIMPRTPEPTPLEEKDASDLTPEDIQELLRRAKEAKGLEDNKRKMKRERTDDNPRPRKVSRPSAGDTQLEIGDDGSFRESSTASLGRAEEPEVIELE